MSLTDGTLVLSSGAFRERVFELSEPALVSDGLTECPATEHWCPATLRSVNAEQLVDVQVSKSGRWKFGPQADPTDQYTIKDVPFGKACDLITSAGPGDPKYYIPHLSIYERLPALRHDLRFPYCLNSSRVYLWFGCAGTITPLHCDIDNNVFGQVYGAKEVILFSPEETSFLYQFPFDSATPHLSFVDVETPDLSKYPLYTKARKTTVTISPGQLLFIPAGWWHHVRSLEVSISVSEWLTPTLSQRAVSSLFWLLITEYKRDRWAHLLESHKMSVAALLDTAEELAQANPRVSVLAAAAAVENSKITQSNEEKITLQISAVSIVLEELVASMVRKPSSIVSSEVVSEIVNRTRNIFDQVKHLT